MKITADQPFAGQESPLNLDTVGLGSSAKTFLWDLEGKLLYHADNSGEDSTGDTVHKIIHRHWHRIVGELDSRS